MGLKFIVAEAQNRVTQASQVSAQAQQAITSLQQSIQRFLSAPLSSTAYDSAKSYFLLAYTPLCQSVILTTEALQEAHKKFLSEFQAFSGIDLDEEQLQREIDQYQQLLETIDEMIRDAKTPRPDLERRATNAYEAKQKRQEKLDNFREYNSRSASFFAEYEACQQELNQGLAQVKDSKAWNPATGTFDLNRLDMSWAKPINERWKFRQKRIDAKVKLYNFENQEIITKFDEYGNVIGIYVDGKLDRELTNTLQESIRTKNFEMIKGFGAGFIDQLANNNGKSMLNEWFGERKVGAELSGTNGYAVGQFIADLTSLIQGGAEFIGGGIWLVGGNFGGMITAPITGGASTVAMPVISGSGLALIGHGSSVLASAWGNLGTGYDFEDNSYNNKNGEWGKGKFDGSADNIQDHFEKHGDEVGANNVEQYMRKAQEFARTVKKGVKPSPVPGATHGVLRYRKNGKYIDLAPDGSIISFGKT